MTSRDSAQIDRVLDAARKRIAPRVDPSQLSALAPKTLIVDLRPWEQRLRDGELPDAIQIDRNVLEWRLDPTSPHRSPMCKPGQSVVLVCDEGYQSSLAASALRDLGVEATDLIGGFQAWRAL
ncbi:MAG TPA: rhodanese-like domain-containing protein [Thermoleophilaceae bacterium]|nr:rhodanese-like domain-containing protein [Thermoleophilaceae bacterium]